jgi:flagellar hook-length control protein FliK
MSGGAGVQGAAAGSNAVSVGDSASVADFNQAVMEQVSGGTIELYRNGGGRVRLSLNPPELGSVDMDLVVDRNGMKLVLFSDSGDVRSVLQANMDQLRGSLHDQGVSRFDILVQDRPASDSGGWQAGGGSGRESMFGGSGSDSGQLRADGGGSGAAAAPGAADNNAAIAASRENSNGELSVFA